MADMSTLGWMAQASTFLQQMGLLEQGRSAKLRGERARAGAEFTAWQSEVAAGNAIAIAQRHALEEQRQSRVLASRALAVAAASGGGVSDPDVVNLIARTRGEGVYRANVALYEGEARERALRLEAAAARVSGADAMLEGARRQEGLNLASAGAGLKGAMSLYAKYGMNGPGTTPGASGDAALIMDAGISSPSIG